MAVRKNGISPDLLIHPGETIIDLLNDRGISQRELAQRAGVSEAFLSDVIHGKKDISKGLAKGLEYALGVPSSFWLNLQANYDAEYLGLQEEDSVKDDEKAVLKEIPEVISFLRKSNHISNGLSKEQLVVSLRKELQVSNLTVLPSLSPAGAFRISGRAVVNPYVLGAWLCLCKAQESESPINSCFDSACVPQMIERLKMIMSTSRGDLQKALKDLFAQYGIDFSIVHNFRGAPVHGYIARKEDGSYLMVVTIRGSFADIFWFSLFHELGHIVNGDIPKVGSFIDANGEEDERREIAANKFASESLLDPISYKRFISHGSFSYESIKSFSQSQNVPPYIVIGRLQKEEYIPWTWFQKYKLKYKWAE